MADELTLQLTVTGTQGAPRVPLKILPTVTATELRQKVSEATSIPLSSLRLIFRGKLIADDAGKQAVEEFKLEEGSVLHCMGKPSSGPAVSREESATALPGSALPSAGPRMTIPPVAAISRVSPLSPTVSDPFKNSLQALRASNSSADYLTAVTTLEKILNNITQHPMEEKYRKVKKDNPAFQRRLGALAAGDLVMQAAGFTTSIENGEEVYLLQQSAEAWPRLLASKAAVSAAVNEAKGAPRPPVVPQSPLLGPVAGDSAAMPFGHTPATQDAMTSLFSDPSALQNMMQNPMVQQMIQNDPRLANNPMIQEVMREIAQNPEAAAQVSALMRDPTAMRQMQNMMQQQRMIPRANTGGASHVNNNDSTGTDEDLTEEEMIAEAIRRSLQDN